MSKTHRIAGLALRLIGVGALCATIAACSGSDVELNGKLFDAMGVSSSSQAAAKVDPKVPARAPLVVPPSTASLPPPGSGTAVVAAASEDQAWPVDPDQQKKAALAAKQQQQKEYCEEGRLQGNSDDFDETKKSKYSRCGNVWTLLFNQNLDQPENADDTPIIVQQKKQGKVEEELPDQE